MSEKVHSEDFFGETRGYWWNWDFLDLMARRWKLSSVSTFLDVGCGFGHWGQALAPFLPPECRIIGVDPEPRSVEEAQRRAQDARFRYLQGSAECLDFPNHSFDVVTCQTVLIHLKDPKLALTEMIRVLKPGGLLAVAEPNNLANTMVQDSAGASLEELLALVAFHGRCQRGKAKLGLGYNSIGDLVPGYFSELGLSGIQVYLSDKAAALFPPYDSAEQKALAQETLSWIERDFLIWDEAETRRYFEADGGETPGVRGTLVEDSGAKASAERSAPAAALPYGRRGAFLSGLWKKVNRRQLNGR